MGIGRSSEARGVVTVERVAVWGLAALAVAALVALAVGPGASLRTAAPDATFETAFDADEGAITVTHAAGDPLRADTTDRLAVVVTDADRNATTTLVWADGAERFPVAAGDSLTVDDPRVDANGDGNYLDGDRSVGFYLDRGDEIAVVWTGRLLGAPDRRTTTLATAAIGAPEQ